MSAIMPPGIEFYDPHQTIVDSNYHFHESCPILFNRIISSEDPRLFRAVSTFLLILVVIIWIALIFDVEMISVPLTQSIHWLEDFVSLSLL